jgi:hypothetical protein
VALISDFSVCILDAFFRVLMNFLGFGPLTISTHGHVTMLERVQQARVPTLLTFTNVTTPGYIHEL